MKEQGTIKYKKLFGIQKALEKQLKELCPNIEHKSGIYFWTRSEENKRYGYIGKSRDVLQRNASHLQGRQQRIDGSLKKRGLYSADNKLGWKLGVLYFPESQLDEKEQYYIKLYQNAGYELYNVESGGTNGKEIIGERQAAKGYYDGLRQGRKNIKRELNKIIDKYLVISTKTDNKLSQRMLEKFYRILDENEKKEGE